MLGELVVDRVLLGAQLLGDLSDLLGAGRGGLATDLEGLELGVVVGQQRRLEVVERRHRRERVEERSRVVGDDDLTDGRDALSLELAHDGVGDLVADGVETLVLAILVGLQPVEVASQVGEVELGVVEALLRRLGLVVEAVDANLDVLDVGVGLRGGCRHESDGSDRGETKNGRANSLAGVSHERGNSSGCRTPTR